MASTITAELMRRQEERVSFSDLEGGIIEGVGGITNLKIKLVYS